MNKVPRRRVLALGATAISGLLAGCGSSVGDEPSTTARSSSENTGTASPPQTSASEPPASTTTSSRDERLPLVYSTSSGPFSKSATPNRGWVHIVADGESADLTFDARLCTSQSVEVTLTNPVSTEYRLNVATESESSPVSSTPSSETPTCGTGTHITGSANVPNDWEELPVTVNGYEIQRLERSGTTGRLWQLPDPIVF
ncbi:hypothetical protein ACFPYI_04370 [Halomarina salina]|uniref:Uncharacterized protein n=1 Tax=Halomarina salina TaxID=1872699 RepID=A0ABD5RJQ3_9EURY|nr:hypothetical protein [Halomarina salina]